MVRERGPVGGVRVGDGQQLVVNYETREGGSVAVELQDATGTPIKGCELASCLKLQGNEIEQVVCWRTAKSVKEFAGKPIQVRFALKEADVYSIRFR